MSLDYLGNISTNQVLVLSGTQDPNGAYNGASIVTKDRVYQEINSDPSWNAVNGYYGLAKDAYPALNPYSSGEKAVSTWTLRSSAANNEWRSVCWSPELGIFVAVAEIVGTGNRVMTSPDGITWTIRTSAADNDWRSVCWSPELGIFVAVGQTGAGNRVMTSPDGIVWTSQLTGISLTNCVASGTTITCDDTTGLTAGMDIGFVSGTGSVPSNTNVVSVVNLTQFTTNNVITTTPSLTLNADIDWRSVCWSPELGLFVAVAATGTGNRVMTSPDGITWNTRTTADNQWRSVCWSPELGIFVAVAQSGTGNRVMTSPNGITWTIRTSAADNNWASVCWAAELGIFVAVSLTGTGNRVMTSSLTGRPPTSYNVFDSSFNNIDASGNWTLKSKSIFSDRNITLDPSNNLIIAGTLDMSGNTITNVPTIQNTTGNVEIITKTTTGSLDLNSTILKFKNTSTTTSDANHNATIKATSNGVSSTTFLKVKLNDADIWIPYFTTDPHL